MGVSPVFLGLFLLASIASQPYLWYLLVISLGAATAHRSVEDEPRTPRLRFLVAIPAHDEEAGIVRSVRSCLAINYPRELFEVLVVADNCQDQTADLARREGATVLERTHLTDRSKGHALNWMLDQLAHTGQLDSVDAVMIVDADSVVDGSLLKVITRYLERGHDWVQVYDTVDNSDDSWRTRLLAYSFGLINGVLLLGQSALGLSAGLRGNGMCFSTRGLHRFPWRSHGLVEDLEYSWNLRIAGEKIAFAPDVCVRATMLAAGGHAAEDQRLRWDFGRDELRAKMLGPLLSSKRLGLTAKTAAVIELLMPTLLFLLGLVLASLALAAGFIVTDSAWTSNVLFLVLLSINTVGLAGFFLYGSLPFFLFSLRWKVLGSLIHLPTYACWKLSMAFRGRPLRWIRTARTSGIPPLPSGEPLPLSSTNETRLPSSKN